MKKFIKTLWILPLILTGSMATAEENLCQLPQGTLTKNRVVIYDKSAGTSQSFDFKLTVQGEDAQGRVAVYDVAFSEDGRPEYNYKGLYQFLLTGCSDDSPTFNVRGVGGVNLGGQLRIINVNRTMGEVTVAGVISETVEGYIPSWSPFGSTSSASDIIDFRQLPITLSN